MANRNIDLDFTVYEQIEKVRVGHGMLCWDVTEKPTNVTVSGQIRELIRSIPNVETTKICKESCYLFAPYNLDHSSLNDCLYVHYTQSDRPVQLGPGRVMIIDRTAGKIVYDGTDGGE